MVKEEKSDGTRRLYVKCQMQWIDFIKGWKLVEKSHVKCSGGVPNKNK